ncbi:Ribosomal protein L24E [Spraguea lophii 42_110]|uniref:Ribosomal protein L24E n=1 Tax=Spraguea lophii (strain 42_110) TaxID=1358809 RepID=S7XSY2_SPRLO|nr:Chain LW0, Ribosomal protein L24E [Spraguea lophii 42_110]7QJH_KW0 Chain KW0, Ribosomal protein L24E [Spraguea lophii 42_110]7QJH_LW0 Chain LW0, Ribosomal protein L24E [Spraguea lophii 42_110]8BR3_LW0 Chain LW0, Ribosomal protein L24E [Spraguea lophii 42_110]8P5D_LW0 Chain LW0, Ribosomal protein L24E [Spraguea lophii 42_110]8P60_KW0 Chain KW0, Ribosomal protein L24E [Spraguea lophii 42_110]8P60_LW0 Chain LW0, Ribosomal protein L24E [Spraguea lophii 42_110]EPR79033.1 Ribosomal protein L24E
MFYEGTCVYSGYPVPRGKGTYFVSLDDKSSLFFSSKYKNFSDKKIKAKRVKQTLMSKQFCGKVESVHTEKKKKIVVQKIVRGFPALPKDAVEKIREQNKDYKKKIVDEKKVQHGKKVGKIEQKQMKQKQKY